MTGPTTSAAVARELDVRPATPIDDGEVLPLLGASLGWIPDEAHADYFRWKHRANPFGASPAWVAVDGDRIVGLRTFLRWEFDDAEGVVRRAVRAVDTATHPDHQGRGIFRLLTMHGLDVLTAEGLDFVFNTPNEQSRPGYLKMGWQVVGRPAVAVRLRGARALAQTVRARVPAGKWSIPTTAGEHASEVLVDDAGVEALLASQPPPSGLRTRRSVSYLRWRYGFEPLHYRAILAGRSVADGFALFRLRARGPATEAVLTDLLVPGDDRRRRAALAGRVAEVTGADHVLRLGGPFVGRDRFVRLPGQGPILTWRAANQQVPAPLEGWQLSLGDVELF
jgi:GNAT superfamily N-acetyltransferase